MPQDIMPRCDIRRNLDHPSRVLGYELVIGPKAGDSRSIHQSDTVDLEELEGRFIHSFTAARAATSEVINDRAMMRFWPVRGPLKKDSVTSSYDRVPLGIRSIEVADNIRGFVGILFYNVRNETGFG